MLEEFEKCKKVIQKPGTSQAMNGNDSNTKRTLAWCPVPRRPKALEFGKSEIEKSLEIKVAEPAGTE